MNDKDTLSRLTEAVAALDTAHEGRRNRGHIERSRVEITLGHLHSVARGVGAMLDQCARSAPWLALDTDTVETVAEFEGSVRATTPLCASTTQALRVAHNAAWAAYCPTEPGAPRFGLMVGENVVFAVEEAAGLLSHGATPVITTAVMHEVVGALLRITELVVELLGRCSEATDELGRNATTATAAEGYRAANQAVGNARRRTVELRQGLAALHEQAGQLRELSVRTRRP
ncbi:hypothetical protein [Actinosynnema pretiosum]|uniref:Uncharacterized protein n=1 Tax=Actinosynnema pretiosum TaxID=42197 RepID=A0A290ZEP4_9PSEU|nr:hypothetical protein [Actinosynnema pretiosum]ATE57491.1 hypothetical protein CNX65_32745 [Actinosynnema pretiosum]